MHEIAPFLAVEGGTGHGDVGVAGEITGPADAVLHARAHDVGGVHVAVDVGLDHAVHRQAAERADHLRVVADLLRPQDDLVSVAAMPACNSAMPSPLREKAVAEATVSAPDRSSPSMPSWITSVRRSAGERPAVEAGQHGVGYVADAGLQRQQRGGQPPAPYFEGQESTTCPAISCERCQPPEWRVVIRFMRWDDSDDLFLWTVQVRYADPVGGPTIWIGGRCGGSAVPQ